MAEADDAAATAVAAERRERAAKAVRLAREVIDEYDDFESSDEDDMAITVPFVKPRPKTWELQYQTPFVTCAYCNTLNFFDAEKFARTRSTDLLAVELERCTGCGKAIVYSAGAHDLYGDVERKRLDRIEMRKKRRRGAAVFQRVFRGFLGRRIARQKRKELAEWLAKINKAATNMQRAARGRQARKIARVEKALLRIKNTVQFVIMDAVRMRSLDGKRRHVFWYKRHAEKKLVFHNYRLFVDRTGNMPPLHVVEANFLELEERIHSIESKAANVIQKVFRGTMSRMFVQELMMEKARIFSVQHTNAIICQRWWREMSAFRLTEQMRYAQVPPQIMKVYRLERFKQREKLEDKHMYLKVKANYKHEIKQARGAFFTGKVAYGSYGGRNLYAFSQSAYKSDTKKCGALIKGLLQRRRRQIDRKQEALERNKVHNKRVDKLLGIKPKLRRYTYLEKKTTVPPPKRKIDRVIEKDRISHITPLTTMIL